MYIRVIFFRWDELWQLEHWFEGNVMVVAKDLKKLATLKESWPSRNVWAIPTTITKISDILEHVMFEARPIFGNNYTLMINCEEQ